MRSYSRKPLFCKEYRIISNGFDKMLANVTEEFWVLDLIIASLYSSTQTLSIKLEKFCGCLPLAKQQKFPSEVQHISFSEQANSRFELDRELFTAVQLVEYASVDQAVNAYVNYCESGMVLGNRMVTIANCLFRMIGKHLIQIARDERDSRHGVVMHQICWVATSWIKLLIAIGHSKVIFSTYQQKEIVESPCLPRKAQEVAQNPNLLFGPLTEDVFQWYFTFLSQCPEPYYARISRILARELFKGLKECKLSAFLVKCFKCIPDARNLGVYRQSFFGCLLNKMFEIAAMNTTLFTSPSANQSHLLYSWIVLAIRLGSARANDQQNPILGFVMRDYQKLILLSAFGPKEIANQNDALRTVFTYLKYVKFHSIHENHREARKTRAQAKSQVFENFQDWAKTDAIKAVLELYQEEAHFIPMQQLVLFLDSAFRTGNQAMSDTAFDICLQKLTPKKMRKFGYDNEVIKSLFNSYLKAMSVSSPEKGLAALSTTTSLAPWFLAVERPKWSRGNQLKLEGLGYNMETVLAAIASQSEMNPDVIGSIFVLVTHCFESVRQNIDSTIYCQNRVRSLISLLAHCWCFDFMKERVSQYVKLLVEQFGDLFVKGESDVFLLSLFDVAGSARSQLSRAVLLWADIFLSYLKRRQFDGDLLRTAIDRLSSFLKPETRLFSMLLAFSSIVKVFPDYITLAHIRSFLIQTTTISAMDFEFVGTLNRLLQEFLKVQTQEGRELFVQMVYEIICPLSILVRMMLMKRVRKLGIPLNIRSLDEIDRGQNLVLWYQRLTLVFICGLQEPINLSDSLKKEVIEMLSFRGQDQGHRMEHLSRILSMIRAIIRKRALFDALTEKEEHEHLFYGTLLNALATRVVPLRRLAKTCFRILKANYMDRPQFARQIDDIANNPDKIFKFYAGFPERITFYRYITKIVPDQVPPSVIRKFFEAVFDFAQKNDVDQLKYTHCFVVILKFFTVKQYVSRPEVKECIFGTVRGSTYFREYISIIIRAWGHHEIPFMAMTQKPVTKFLLIFPEETISYLLSPECQDYEMMFTRDLIVNDASLKLFEAFLDFAEKANKDVLPLNPSAFQLIEHLSKNRQFASNERFLGILNTALPVLLSKMAERQSKNGNYDYLSSMMSQCVSAIVRTYQYSITVKEVVKMAKLTSYPFFQKSYEAKLLVRACFKKTSPEFVGQLLKYLVDSFEKLNPCVVGNLLSYAVKSRTDMDLSFLWGYLDKWMSVASHTWVAVRVTVQLLRKYSPTGSQLQFIFTHLKHLLGSPNVDVLVYSLKLCVQLLKMRSLPDFIFQSLLRAILTHTKFCEMPYCPYVFRILRMAPSKWLESLPEDTTEALILYVQANFLMGGAVWRVLKQEDSLILAAPRLFDHLPFSLLASLSLHIFKRIRNMTEKRDNCDFENEKRIIETMLISLIRVCLVTNPKQDEIHVWMKVCFEYLKVIIELQDFDSAFLPAFFDATTKLNVVHFPVNLLKDLKSVSDPISFAIVCLSGKVNPERLVKEFEHCVRWAIGYTESMENYVNTAYFDSFLKAVGQHSVLFSQFIPSIESALSKMLQSAGISMSGRIVTCARALMKNGCVRYWKGCWEYYGRCKEQKQYDRNLVEFLIESVEYMPYDRQLSYIEMVFEHLMEDTYLESVLVSKIPLIFDSSSVMLSVKLFLLDNLAHILISGQDCDFDAYIMAINRLDTASIDIRSALVQLFIIRASRCDNSERLSFLERAIVLLPADRKDRIIYLFQKIPIVLWQDRYVPLLVSLVAMKGPIWQPLFMLSHRLSSIGSELISVTLQDLLDEDNLCEFERFLGTLLKNKKRSHLNHMQVVSGLIRMFYITKTRIHVELAQKAIQYSGHIHLLEYFLPPDIAPRDRWVMLHRANDLVYGIYRHTLTAKQAAAVAMTFLNEYEAARQCYSSQDGNDFFKKMELVNNHFISDAENTSSLFKSLNSHVDHTDGMVHVLEEAVVAFKAKNHEVFEDRIQCLRFENICSVGRRPYVSSFEKERLVLIEAMCSKMLGNQVVSSDIASMNHAFAELFRKFKDFLVEKPSKSCEIDRTDPCLLLMPSMRSQFDRVCGYTSRGLVAVGKEHIEMYFAKINERIATGVMNATDWQQFAAFSFNIYCAKPSNDLFNASFAAYCKVLKENYDFPQYVLNEAAARLITMCRLGFAGNEDLVKTLVQTQNIFQRSMGEVWRFWLQQLVELARVPWFCDVVYELFQDMSYRSYIYARKDQTKPLEDAMNKFMQDKPTKQIAMMEVCQTYLSSLFDVSFEEKQNQEELLSFAKESARLSNPESIDLLELRKQIPSTPFTRALGALSLNQMSLIGDFQTFVEKVKQLDSDQLVAFIQQLTNSSCSLKTIKEHVSKATQQINDNLPFIFPLRVEQPYQITLLQILDGFEFLSSDMVMIRMVTSMDSWKYYIAQKSLDEQGYHKSVLTLANTLFLFRTILQRTYSASSRNLIAFPSQFFEIGASMIFVPVMDHPITFESLFKHVTMMTCNEWLTQNVRSDLTNPPRFSPYDRTAPIINMRIPYADQSTLHITPEGRERIKEIPGDAIKRLMLQVFPEDDYLKMRASLAKSTSVSCFIRHLFNARYPSMQRCLGCAVSGIVPILHSDFDHGMITSTEESPFTAFRISPNIVSSLGMSLKGESLLTMAVIAKALTTNIESVRSWIETLINDEDFDAGRTCSLPDLMETRKIIESKFLTFCPPRIANTSPETCEEWLVGIEEFITKSADPSVQPIEAIPWF